MHTPWEDRYAQRTANMQDSAIRELLKLTQQPEIISFAGGLPAPEVFPLENFRIACEKVLIEKESARARETLPKMMTINNVENPFCILFSKCGSAIKFFGVIITRQSKADLDYIWRVGSGEI